MVLLSYDGKVWREPNPLEPDTAPEPETLPLETGIPVG